MMIDFRFALRQMALRALGVLLAVLTGLGLLAWWLL